MVELLRYRSWRIISETRGKILRGEFYYHKGIKFECTVTGRSSVLVGTIIYHKNMIILI